jgi:hypothetical protein
VRGRLYCFFGDDIHSCRFIQNHIRFLQTYSVGICSGLDIRADAANLKFGP